MIDEQFIQRVYRSSIVWSLVILSWLMMNKLIPATVGFALGVAIGLGVLRTIEAVVKKVLTPGERDTAKMKMGIIGVIKYGILGLLIGMVVKAGWISLPAFACGIGVPTAIIFMKTLAHTFREIEFHPFWGTHYDPRVQESE
jgi:hypothetical protein